MVSEGNQKEDNQRPNLKLIEAGGVLPLISIGIKRSNTVQSICNYKSLCICSLEGKHIFSLPRSPSAACEICLNFRNQHGNNVDWSMVIIKLLMFVHYASFILGVMIYRHHVAQLNTTSMCKASCSMVKHLENYHSTDLLKINIL